MIFKRREDFYVILCSGVQVQPATLKRNVRKPPPGLVQTRVRALIAGPTPPPPPRACGASDRKLASVRVFFGP
jgi:hypothetical protein